jgi:hypothetical protein
LKSGSFNLLEASGPVKACNGIALPLPYYALMTEAKATGAVLGRKNILCLTNQITKHYIPPMAFFGL